MLDNIFGGEMSTAVRFVIAFGVVLSLIALTFVGLRRLAGRKLPLSNAGRARQPRLGVLDAFAIDARRRLVLIRRDNVEHLIMIGGPNDVLVESEIVRAPAQAALAPQRAQRTPGENTRAAVPGPERARALPPPPEVPVQQAPQYEPEPQPVTTPAAFRTAFPPRPAARPAAPQVNAAPPPPPPQQRAPAARPQQRAPEPVAEYQEPERPMPTMAPQAKPKAEIDPLYADIERKLGEALSRPASAPPTPPAPTRSAPPPPPMRAPAPPPRAAAPPPPAPPRREPAPPAPRAASRNHLDALEDEMASLLGRDRAT